SARTCGCCAWRVRQRSAQKSAAAIFLFTLIPYFPVAKNFQKELFGFIEDLTPNNETKTLILTTMNDLFNKPKTGLLSIGFILALFYSSNAMMRIIKTFDRSLAVKRKENFLRRRLRAIRLTLVLIFVLIATILLSIGQGVLFINTMKWLNIQHADNNFWIQILRWFIIITLFLYSISFIYKYAPSVHKRWKLLSPGAVLATALIMLATWLFSVWAQDFSNYNKVYGSIGALLMIMLLVWVNSLMLLVGYELNVSIHHLKDTTNRIERRRIKRL
ncbi:MAG: YihY/virulence factor BrkB family protein, partial [Parafilimonas sp.]